MRRQALSIALSRGFGSALQALTIVLLGRAIGVVDFGLLMAYVGLAAILNVFADFGITNFTSKAHARHDLAATRAALTFNVYASLVSAISLAAGALVTFGIHAFGIGVALVGVALSIEKNSNTISSIPLAEGRALQATASFLIRRVIALFGFLIFSFGLSFDAALAYGLSMVAGAIAGQLYLRTVLSLPGREVTRISVIDLARRTRPFFVGNLTMQLKSIDASLVALISSAYGAGLYAAASRLTTPFLFVPTALTQVILPHSARTPPERTRSIARKLYVLTALLLLTTVPFIVMRGTVMTTLFGDDYLAAGDVLALTLIGIPFFATSSALGALLQGQDDERFVAANGALFAGLIIGGIALGAAIAGPSGAAGLASAALLGKALSLSLRVEIRHRRLSR